MFFCIPTINGEINGDPILLDTIFDVQQLEGEWTVYFIKSSNLKIVELD